MMLRRDRLSAAFPWQRDVPFTHRELKRQSLVFFLMQQVTTASITCFLDKLFVMFLGEHDRSNGQKPINLVLQISLFPFTKRATFGAARFRV